MAEEVFDSEEANVETASTLTTEETPAEGANASAAEEKTGEAEQGKDATGDKPQEAPESYESFTLPDGMEMTKEENTQANEVFKDLNLSQKQAQKLIDFEVKRGSEKDARIQSAWDQVNEGWVTDSKSDSEFGGTALNESLAIAKIARDAYGNDKFTEMLEVTGVGNHPEMIRFLIKAGKPLKDDKILQGSYAGGAEKNAAKTLFPDMN
jgi:hypothetical protein